MRHSPRSFACHDTTGPALDEALVELNLKPEKSKYHYGPIVNNRDCEERKSKASCKKVEGKGCVWNSFGGDDKGCSACPYMYGAYSKEVQIRKCEGTHKAPNGRKCVFSGGVFHNQCCAQSQNDKDGKWGEGHLCYG